MKALIYLITGALAMGLVLGSDEQASQTGALASLASIPVGRVLLWIAVGALGGLGVWQWTPLNLSDNTSRWRKGWRRFVAIGKSVGYFGTAAITLAFAAGYTIRDGHALEVLSGRLLATAAGTLIVVLIAGIVIVVGIVSIVRGLRLTFFQEIRIATLTRGLSILVRVAGRVGYVTRGLSFVLVGSLLIAAALFAYPTRAGGLDSALDYLTTLRFGPTILTVLAIGLVLNAIYFALRMLFLPYRSSSPGPAPADDR